MVQVNHFYLPAYKAVPCFGRCMNPCIEAPCKYIELESQLEFCFEKNCAKARTEKETRQKPGAASLKTNKQITVVINELVEVKLCETQMPHWKGCQLGALIKINLLRSLNELNMPLLWANYNTCKRDFNLVTRYILSISQPSLNLVFGFNTVLGQLHLVFQKHLNSTMRSICRRGKTIAVDIEASLPTHRQNNVKQRNKTFECFDAVQRPKTNVDNLQKVRVRTIFVLLLPFLWSFDVPICWFVETNIPIWIWRSKQRNVMFILYTGIPDETLTKMKFQRSSNSHKHPRFRSITSH